MTALMTPSLFFLAGMMYNSHISLREQTAVKRVYLINFSFQTCLCLPVLFSAPPHLPPRLLPGTATPLLAP